MLATTSPVELISALSSLIGTLTVAFLAISSRLAERRRVVDAQRAEQDRLKLDRKVTAVAATGAAVAANVANVVGKIDTNTKVTESIHREVQTSNGITSAELLERQEGRRIEDIPEHDRTASEQEYVDKLVAGGRNMGHEN